MRRLLLAAALGLVAAPVAQAQNLLGNPNFDTNLSGWSNGNPSITSAWDSQDVLSDPASGSALVTSTQTEAGAGSGLIQCVDIAGSGTPRRFEISSFYLIPGNQVDTAAPDLSLVWFTSGGCVNFINGAQFNTAQGASTTDTWIQLQGSTDAPLDAQSVRVFLRPRIVEPGGSVDVLFDAVFLPEPDSAALGLAAFASLWALRRRSPASPSDR